MIAANIQKINQETGDKARLIAVSKTKPTEMLQMAYDAGQRLFGENKVQEITQKQPLLPKDIEWHFIGHLQTNKVKYIAPFVSMIHSVDSWKLLETINKEGQKNNRIIQCLLQVYIASEETKYGMDKIELTQILNNLQTLPLTNILVCGVMGMASNTQDTNLVRTEFRRLKSIFEELKTTYFPFEPSFKEISMGMSGDYKIALEEGSTLIRVGSLVFGER